MKHSKLAALNEMKIGFVSADIPKWTKLVDELKAVPSTVQLFSSTEELVQRNPKEFAIIFLDCGASIAAALTKIETLAILFSQVPVAILFERADDDLGAAFYRGADASFMEPIRVRDLLTGMGYLLESQVGASIRKFERHKTRKTFCEYSTRSGVRGKGAVVNISPGGVYIFGQSDFPSIHEIIDFTITSDKFGDKKATGRAYVRWIKSKIEFGRPPGFGAEFVNLDEQTTQLINSLISNFKISK